MSTELPVNIRPAREGDFPFVAHTWVHSYREESKMAKSVPPAVYFPNQHALVDRLLKQSEVMIACDKEDDNHLYGWVCSQRWKGLEVFHYAYVKKPFRGFGLGKILIGDKLHHLCHVTHWLEKYAKKKQYLVHNPYPLYLYGGLDDDKRSKTENTSECSA